MDGVAEDANVLAIGPGQGELLSVVSNRTVINFCTGDGDELDVDVATLVERFAIDDVTRERVSQCGRRLPDREGLDLDQVGIWSECRIREAADNNFDFVRAHNKCVEDCVAIDV